MTNRKTKKFSWLWLLLFIVTTVIFYISSELTSSENGTTVNPPTQVVLGSSTAETLVPQLSDGNLYEVYFTNPTIPFTGIYTGGIEDYLIAKIDTATTSINAAVFEFDIESVAQALIRASNRGVDVKVVYDNEFSDPDPQIGELQRAGIQTTPDNRSGFMHNKFFVIDKNCIWTGSFNISLNAAYRNNENALYFCSNEIAENYRTEFMEMFAGQFGPDSPSNTPYPSFSYGGIGIENYFSPEDNAMDKIIAAVSSATTSVHFMAFSFTDSNLSETMLQEMNRGVSLSGIFESSGANTEYSQCQTLLSAGADITLDGNPRTFHHKVIIIDDSIVILGSFNFSVNANENNDENLLIIHDASLASAYEREFQRMKLQSIRPLGNSCTK